MTDKPLKLLGLMRRAGAVEIGADRSTEAARAGKARVLLLASDAGDNAAKKAEYALAGKSALKLELPFSREELSEALGVGDCTMAAVTEIGFAEALVKQLADEDAAVVNQLEDAVLKLAVVLVRGPAEAKRIDLVTHGRFEPGHVVLLVAGNDMGRTNRPFKDSRTDVNLSARAPRERHRHRAATKNCTALFCF